MKPQLGSNGIMCSYLLYKMIVDWNYAVIVQEPISQIKGLAQDCGISSALAREIP